MPSISCPKKVQSIYRPRKPEKTVLFEAIKKNYTSWHGKSEEFIPEYVNNEFKKYLECGILAKGFACAHCDSCNKDFFIAFSCKGRGLCPSCNTRQMVETAANLVENLIPQVPVRQFVMSFPKKIRYYLKTNKILCAVLGIVVDEIRKNLISCCADVPNGKIGAISFIQNFGNTLNFHPHFHLIVADGVFANEEDSALFYESFMTSDNINATEESIQKRVLRYFCRSGFFDKESTEKMLASENSGFSLNADVRIQSWDREGLERLIRYCARPCFKSENLRWNGLWLRYQFPKPTHKGKTFIQLEPVEFIEKISKLIPYPRRHRRHYHGVFAPNSPLRAKISANAKKCSKSSISPDVEKSAEKAKGVSFSWAKLIARIYEVNPLICECGKEIKIVAFITHPAEIQRILLGIGWSVKIPDFDPPCDFDDVEICQLIPGTDDGFPDEVTFYGESGPDPPSFENFIDPPQWEDCYDAPHQENYIDSPHWED